MASARPQEIALMKQLKQASDELVKSQEENLKALQENIELTKRLMEKNEQLRRIYQYAEKVGNQEVKLLVMDVEGKFKPGLNVFITNNNPPMPKNPGVQEVRDFRNFRV